MNTIKKHSTFFKVLLIALVGYFSLVGFWTGFFTKLKMESYIKSKTGMNVEMGLTYVYPFTGNGFIKDIRLPNPEGSISKTAFSIDEISFKGKTFFTDTIQIESMKVSGIQIHFEGNGRGSNFHTIFMKSALFYRGRDSDKDEWFKRIYTHHLYIDPVHIVLGDPGANQSLELEALNLDEVGTKEDGIAWNRLGLLLATQYKPTLIKAMQDPASPFSPEVRSFVVQWFESHPAE